MKIQTIISKLHRLARYKVVNYTKHYSFYPILYPAWWHSKLHHPNKNQIRNYLTAVPNPGAGIGHQIANWIAGYWFAKLFDLQFAHTPFTPKSWDDLLGFGVNEAAASELLTNKYRKVILPFFDENSKSEVDRIKRIISSYSNTNTLFSLEQDQFYFDQFGNIEDIQRKFHNSPSRLQDHLEFSRTDLNIAIHIRRGDILAGKTNNNQNLLMRYQNSHYFLETLKNTLASIQSRKTIKIFIFSQGIDETLSEFNSYKNIKFCTDMGAKESFLHMVFADILITSKSSFSYKPALLSQGIKICPKNFWHGYPKTPDWILVDEDGRLSDDTILRRLS